MKFITALNNFTAGEWSPKMSARTDVEQYVRSCVQLKNFQVQMQGGAFRRAGGKYLPVAAGIQADLDAADFDQLKMIPYGDEYTLVCVDTDTSNWFLIDNVGAQYALTVSSKADYTEIPTAYTQIGDILFLVSENAAPRVVYPVGGNFQMKIITDDYITIKPWETVPYKIFTNEGTAGQLTVTGTFTVGGSVTVTCNTDRFNALDGNFKPYIKVSTTTSTGVIRIDTFTNAQSVTGTVVYALPGTSPSNYGGDYNSFFELCEWDIYSFPSTAVGFQGRIYFGKDETIYGSRIGDVFEMMEVPFVDDPYFADYAADNTRPFSLTPNSKESAQIVGLSASKTLVINTNKAEIVAFGTQGAMGPLDFTFESSTSFGAERVQPERVNNYLTFVQKGGRKLRDVQFSFDEAEYKSNDLSFVADHLTESEYFIDLGDGSGPNSYGQDQINELVAVEGSSSYLYCRTRVNKLISVTLDRDYQVNAWNEIVIGGNNPRVLAIAPIKSVYGSEYLRIIVRREINGVDKTYIEEIRNFNEFDDFFEEKNTLGTSRTVYMDSWIERAITASTTVDGLTHLTGETVQVIADGIYQGEKTVNSSGEITLQKAASLIYVGLKYESILQPAYIEQGSQVGSSQGTFKKIEDIYVRLWKSYGGKYGKPGGFYPFPSLDLTSPPSTTNRPLLFTGEHRVQFNAGYERKFSLILKQDEPFPFNVLCIAAKGVSYD